MAYDQDLADRIRLLLGDQPGLTEQPMFGGLAFLVNGNLAASASSRGGMLLRVDKADTDSLVDDRQVRRFEMRGRAMDGWLHVDVDALGSDEELLRWLGYGVSYARALPPK